MLIDAVETAGGAGIDAGDMIAIVREMLAGGEAWSFANDLVALDDQVRAVGVVDHPFAAKQRDGAIRRVFDGDKIDERVWLVLRQAHAAVVINELIETGGEAG